MNLEKKVKVNNKQIPKHEVLRYYRNLWKKNPAFRNTVKTKGVFIRASYKNKDVIKRHNIRINNLKDLERAVDQHAVEFIIPIKKTRYKNYVDIDMPRKHLKQKRSIAKSIVNKMRKKTKVNMVVETPRGIHIYSNSDKKTIHKACKQIADEDKRMIVGKTSKNKIVLDPNESAVAIPGSLSTKGKPYRRIGL